MTNPPGHLWREKWTALSGPLSECLAAVVVSVNGALSARKPKPPPITLPIALSRETSSMMLKRFRGEINNTRHPWGILRSWELVYRGTSRIRKRTPLGPYRRPMPRVVGGSLGGGRFLMGEVPLYHGIVGGGVFSFRGTHAMMPYMATSNSPPRSLWVSLLCNPCPSVDYETFVAPRAWIERD